MGERVLTVEADGTRGERSVARRYQRLAVDAYRDLRSRLGHGDVIPAPDREGPGRPGGDEGFGTVGLSHQLPAVGLEDDAVEAVGRRVVIPEYPADLPGIGRTSLAKLLDGAHRHGEVGRGVAGFGG